MPHYRIYENNEFHALTDDEAVRQLEEEVEKISDASEAEAAEHYGDFAEEHLAEISLILWGRQPNGSWKEVARRRAYGVTHGA